LRVFCSNICVFYWFFPNGRSPCIVIFNYSEISESIVELLLQARDIQKALDGFTRAVQLDPDNGEAWNNIACLYALFAISYLAIFPI
jgi:tetratricopeptide (TPR) repeat protein